MNDIDLVTRYKLRKKTSICQDCGVESTIWFGMATSCRKSEDGMHRNMVEVDTTEENEYAKLYGAYHGGMWFDRDRFMKSESPLAELGREILAKGGK
jgi:predicted ATP-dependent serine protease